MTFLGEPRHLTAQSPQQGSGTKQRNEGRPLEGERRKANHRYADWRP
jgi:hypothetical protein